MPAMADFPALPLWTDAYLADTLHLSTEEHGAYLLLLMTAWRSPDCTLPDDDDRLARMARVGAKKWAKMRPVLAHFWTVDDGRWKQKRLLKERERAEKNRDQKRHAAAAKHRKNNNTGAAGGAAPHMRSDLTPEDGQSRGNCFPKASAGSATSRSRERHSVGGNQLKNHDTGSADADAEGVRNGSYPYPYPYPVAAAQSPQQDGETRAPPGRGGDAAAGLIGIVDDAIARHFGEAMRRPWPTPRDHPTAQAWLEAGATPDQVRAVADAVLARMAATGREPPKSLAYLDGAVRDAVAGKPPTVAKANGEPAPFKPGPTWEERLRARVGHWQANRWDRRWGPPPDDPRCEVPADLIVEVLGDAAPPAARERLETVT